MALKNYPLFSVVLTLVALCLQIVHGFGYSAHHGALWIYALTAIVQVSQGTICFAIYLFAAYKNRRRKIMSRHLAGQLAINDMEKQDGQLGRFAANSSGSREVGDEGNAIGTKINKVESSYSTNRDDDGNDNSNHSMSSQLLSSSLPEHRNTRRSNSGTTNTTNNPGAVAGSEDSEFDPGYIIEFVVETFGRCLCWTSFHSDSSDPVASKIANDNVNKDLSASTAPITRESNSINNSLQRTSNSLDRSFANNKVFVGIGSSYSYNSSNNFQSFNNANSTNNTNLYGPTQPQESSHSFGGFSGHSIFSNDGGGGHGHNHAGGNTSSRNNSRTNSETEPSSAAVNLFDSLLTASQEQAQQQLDDGRRKVSTDRLRITSSDRHN
jgi:hypothetical protein